MFVGLEYSTQQSFRPDVDILGVQVLDEVLAGFVAAGRLEVVLVEEKEVLAQGAKCFASHVAGELPQTDSDAAVDSLEGLRDFCLFLATLESPVFAFVLGRPEETFVGHLIA